MFDHRVVEFNVCHGLNRQGAGAVGDGGVVSDKRAFNVGFVQNHIDAAHVSYVYPDGTRIGCH